MPLSTKKTAVVGLCPVHRGEFYVPHAGTCPQYGCDETLTQFVALDYEPLTYLLDALSEARSSGAWSHWNKNAKGWLDEAIQQLYIAEEEARPDA